MLSWMRRVDAVVMWASIVGGLAVAVCVGVERLAERRELAQYMERYEAERPFWVGQSPFGCSNGR